MREAVGVVLAAEQFALPQGVVRVLYGQWLPGGCRVGQPRRVRGAQVACQGCHRPLVAGDVVHHQQQHVLGRGELEQRGAQRRFAVEVEGCARCLGQQTGQVPGSGLGHRQGHRAGVEHQLSGQPAGLGEHRTQRLVATYHVVQCRPQCRLVQRTAEPQGQRHVVGRVRALDLLQEPQAPLCEREWHSVRSRHRPQCRTHRLDLGDPAGQLGHRRRLEEGAQREFQAEFGTDPAGQSGGQQGVAAEVEETVVDADPVDVEHLGEQPAEDLLPGAPRGAARALGLEPGSGQRSAVQLAVGRQWQGVQEHHRCGHHVSGQGLADVRPQLGSVHGGGAGDHVGDQPLVAGLVLLGYDRGLGDLRVAGQHRLDLAEFDPETADLHLVVRAALVGQRAVRGPARQVAGAVHP